MPALHMLAASIWMPLASISLTGVKALTAVRLGGFVRSLLNDVAHRHQLALGIVLVAAGVRISDTPEADDGDSQHDPDSLRKVVTPSLDGILRAKRRGGHG